MAYCKRKYYSQDSYSSHIIIYNLVSNKIENKIYNAGYGTIQTLKHYKSFIISYSYSDVFIYLIKFS